MGVSELYGKVAPYFEGVGGLEAVEGTIRDLCWYTVRISEVQGEIAEHGSMVETPRGRVANPACALLHQYMTDKNSCLKALLPLIGKASAKDEFMEFVTRGV